MTGFFDDKQVTVFELDLAYSIMPDGRIITSDGEPRGVDEFQLRFVAEQAEKAGLPPPVFRFVKAGDPDDLA